MVVSDYLALFVSAGQQYAPLLGAVVCILVGGGLVGVALRALREQLR